MHVWIVVLVGPVLRCSYALARGYSLRRTIVQLDLGHILWEYVLC